MRKSCLLLIILYLFFSGKPDKSEPGTIYFQAFDLHDRPVPGVIFGIRGGNMSKATTNNGETEIKVPGSVMAGSKLQMTLVSSGVRDLVIFSPMHGNFIVPAFDNNPNNTQDVYLAVKGDRMALADIEALRIITTEINKINRNLSPQIQANQDQLASTVEDASDVLGVSPQDLDKSIRHAGRHIGAASVISPSMPELYMQITEYKNRLPEATNKFGFNLAGNWKGTLSTPDGNEFPLTYNLSFTGNQLTGKITSAEGESTITDGRINGDNFTFSTQLSGQQVTQQGVFYADSLIIHINPGQGFPALKIKLLRNK